jgi:hypothetical protein
MSTKKSRRHALFQRGLPGFAVSFFICFEILNLA